VVERAEPDLLSFDLALDELDDTGTDVLAGLLGRGCWVAWGAIRVDGPEGGEDALRRLDATLGGINADPSHSLLSPSCGSGRMSVSRERAIVAGLDEAATALRERIPAGGR
jgi:hypothetical protein